MVNKPTRETAGFLACLICAASCVVRAEVVEYDDKQAWEAAAGGFTTIGFADLPDGTWVTEQYADLGAHFVDGWDQVVYGEITFPEDGVGLVGGEQIDIVFDQPMYWIGADFPGGMIVQLYLGGEMFYQSSYFGGTGYGNFGGLLSTLAFDRAVLRDDDEYVAIDDVHFGPPIPAPPVLCILGGALVRVRRQRRR
ncbi:MAG: hypothetical protein SYC29_16310 [Planctomycetota bacterium]|nr:hypothetical protein [Planctomycetota bacterium]